METKGYTTENAFGNKKFESTMKKINGTTVGQVGSWTFLQLKYDTISMTGNGTTIFPLALNNLAISNGHAEFGNQDLMSYPFQ